MVTVCSLLCSVVTVCYLSLGRGCLQCGDCLFSFFVVTVCSLSLGSVGGLQCGEVFSVVTVCSLSLGRGGLQCGDCLFSFFGEGRSAVW